MFLQQLLPLLSPHSHYLGSGGSVFDEPLKMQWLLFWLFFLIFRVSWKTVPATSRAPSGLAAYEAGKNMRNMGRTEGRPAQTSLNRVHQRAACQSSTLNRAGKARNQRQPASTRAVALLRFAGSLWREACSLVPSCHCQSLVSSFLLSLFQNVPSRLLISAVPTSRGVERRTEYCRLFSSSLVPRRIFVFYFFFNFFFLSFRSRFRPLLLSPNCHPCISLYLPYLPYLPYLLLSSPLPHNHVCTWVLRMESSPGSLPLV
jgi:hypothetical protein